MIEWAAGLIPLSIVTSVLRAAVIAVVGVVGSRLASELAYRITSRSGRLERAALARKITRAGILVLAALTAMSELGFDLSILLGAAGVASVAIGFASQTSASNIISGLFLIAERPFSVGDIIEVGTRSGVVLEIDLMSIKLRTFDNRFVRIPNESVMKADVVNLTRFAIRRIDLPMTIPHTADLPLVHIILSEVAAKTTLVLDEPRPDIMIQGFSPAGTEILFIVWVERTSLVAVRTDLVLQIHKRLREEGIDLSPRQRTVLLSR
jgi:small-conductance mechanosensitive channel